MSRSYSKKKQYIKEYYSGINTRYHDGMGVKKYLKWYYDEEYDKPLRRRKTVSKRFWKFGCNYGDIMYDDYWYIIPKKRFKKQWK